MIRSCSLEYILKQHGLK